MALPTMMNAVVFEGPGKVSVQQRPVPKSRCSTRFAAQILILMHCRTVQDDQDIIVKVHSTALCGS